ncbi:MAG: hypothetical protein JNM17_32820 [Archangium sp.]|nr:hypothetical protein [Archangium sp.]
MRVALFAVVLSASVSWAQEETPPPLPPPDPVPQPTPQQLPPLLVPKEINNAPLNPEQPIQQTDRPPFAAPVAEEDRYVPLFGPMAHIAINSINNAWDRSVPLPGLAGTIGLRMSMMRRSEASQFTVAGGAFFGLEAINFVVTLSPGLRVELMGVHGPVLIPYLSLSLFGQVLVPINTRMTNALTGMRVGLAFSWNLSAIPGAGRWWSGWGGGGGSGSWIIIPIAIVAALIAFGDVRLYLQTDPAGRLVYGLGIGFGF